MNGIDLKMKEAGHCRSGLADSKTMQPVYRGWIRELSKS